MPVRKLQTKKVTLKTKSGKSYDDCTITRDDRLREFRVVCGLAIRFVPFESKQGKKFMSIWRRK